MIELFLFLLFLLELSTAWVTTPLRPLSMRTTMMVPSLRLQLARSSSSTPDNTANEDDDDDDDDEFMMDCADEEECEIDWDAMPTTTTTTDDTAAEFANQRNRLEMTWGLSEAAEDCDVEVPTSCGSDVCETCHGSGHTLCRFCKGTAVLYMAQQTQPPSQAAYYGVDTVVQSTRKYGPQQPVLEKDFTTCPICQQGMETCKSCQGTGWVASWTQYQAPAR